MILNRRAALGLGLSALAAPAFVRPAGAASCALPDLDRGILFTRKDGSRGLARRESDGMVVIDYVTNRGDRIDRRRVENGVFETSRVLSESELPVVGSAPPEFTWTYGRKTVAPQASTGWSGKVKEVRKDVGYGDFMKEIVSRSRTSWDAVFSFLPGKPVRLSGCSYETVPVEATFTGKAGAHSRRWVYFPQLGLGLETRRDGVANGLVALTST
ncbi:hypothetical protein LHP98_00330 [Rhodobacter sp. Har01]|uniref:hypothetical protein n=1 Tax=Rhodobacter sp. Har01 TaxID=2883999 RepID=UPI001D07D09A|nr:hypothetical protein [Rhodobacter sp. Har01]MCB6176575.1 hypothetical protein [Rhodobacter sp. Har01]